uniref:PDZ domain-containing protein n=1 Tax=Sinocyclocheilus anshuiensis TaxID=1608454 RepID=A0A671Q7M0_9TELE
DNEGFGFVLRGAKAQTPIEEFTPTPAFPALQYLESVDEGGVAWRAGLRMGDFLIEVNGQNVVKVGHRQVVNMIRQGSNSLMVKVVMVTRNPDMEEGARKKIPQQSKRLSTPAIALRSKSMTSELEEMGKMWEMRGQKHGGGKVQCFPTFFDPYSPLTTAQLPLNQHKPEMFNLNSYYAGYDLQKINNFDPYNVFLAIASNISQRLKTGFVLQGHIY